MTINNLPVALQQLVLDGWLMRFFQSALFPNLLYRNEYEAFEAPQRLGETYTFTRKGLLPLVTTALAPPANSDLNSGLTPANISYEQYSVTLQQIAQASQTNLLSSGIALADLYKSDVEALGDSAGRSLDQFSRRTLFEAYGGGRTFITAGVTGVKIAVDNVKGFETVYVNGVSVTTSVANPHPVTVTESGVPDATLAVTGVIPGSLNINDDTTPGSLTLDASVTVITGDTVISDYAPFSLRPNGKTTSHTIAAADTVDLADFNAAVAQLKKLAVPTHRDGFYHAIVDPVQMNQLMNDPAVQRIYNADGAGSPEFMYGGVAIAGRIKFFESPVTPNSTNAAGVEIRRAIITGRDPGYEVRSALIGDWLKTNQLSATGAVVFMPEHHISLIMRTPQDILQQVVTTSFSFIGNWVAGTDVLSTIGGSAAYYKRCVMIESA